MADHTGCPQWSFGLYNSSVFASNHKGMPMVDAAHRADFLRETETKSRRVSTLALFESLGMGFDFLEVLLPEIDGPGMDEVNAYVREFLAPEKALEVIIGPKAEP